MRHHTSFSNYFSIISGQDYRLWLPNAKISYFSYILRLLLIRSKYNSNADKIYFNEIKIIMKKYLYN